MNIPGRSCPLDYNIDQSLFAKKENDIICDTVYIVGGLYGNYQALEEIDKIVKSEKSDCIIIFNGDIHWFDKDYEDFVRIENFVRTHIPLLGNVESELIRDKDINVGCGCSYPGCVDDDVVKRSNIIHQEMKDMVDINSKIKDEIKKRQKICIVKVGDKRIAITHGDEKSLAGWECSRENLLDINRQNELISWFKDNDIDVIASTHTCAPVALKLENFAVINNGASGMPNFKDKHYGIITRISKCKSEKAIYSSKIDYIYIEALAVNYNINEFVDWFDNVWPNNSPASISYRERIIKGTADNIEDAILSGFEIN
ncbi:metallophosphoesterase [Peptostreptococcus equinus]|uniref:Calcineurin phosphoesterase n=1 Tax=Peptostreptococcus equinus TaxID=3003601 RepID=A0ABY7JRG2_9FIRM|nr:metallophosphoesterase [Peptostreptococcus sp. CBA3647]WAW14537.1 calcineurin phosphoesterase [Peptostreptococcus sp. CBA3647]